MADQPNLIDPVPQPVWTPLRHKGACRRNPNMGPGTCIHWWEGCPKPEFRNCYQKWAASQPDAKRGA